MQSSTRAVFRAGLAWAMGLSAVVYIGGLVLLGDAAGTVVYRWLGMLTMCLPTAVCWLAVLRGGLRRKEVLLAAAAVTSFAAGNIYYFAMVAAGGSLPFPCSGDVGYLLFYPLMLAAFGGVGAPPRAGTGLFGMAGQRGGVPRRGLGAGGGA